MATYIWIAFTGFHSEGPFQFKYQEHNLNCFGVGRHYGKLCKSHYSKTWNPVLAGKKEKINIFIIATRCQAVRCWTCLQEWHLDRWGMSDRWTQRSLAERGPGGTSNFSAKKGQESGFAFRSQGVANIAYALTGWTGCCTTKSGMMASQG